MFKYKIVFVRHGESEWNLKNLFCGWVDVDLSVQGREEALTSGQALKQAGLKFDLVFTSLLKRAHQTLDIVLQEIEQTDLSVVKSWKLNERHYGGLTGLNKADAAAKYGDKQVQIWRRSYNVPPPVMEEDHPMNNVIVNNPKFSMIRKEDFPKVESLEMTQRRVVAFWTEEIVPHIKTGKKVLVVAHGTSLRGLVKYLEGISDEDVMNLNLPTGIPFVYELNENMKPIKTLQYLADEETVLKSIAKVASVGGTTKQLQDQGN
uniref:phosphoglycerate mutase (2,3-diphosphoglycerate-dependent) n=1 Tax=Timema genevievae TaxID=629358 RepID=A0A7R9PKU6_TIMGE|nr:unnamed protein product [Timema genevievae]